MEDLRYKVALSMVPGVGSQVARNLLAHFGDAEAVFRASPQQLQKVTRVGPVIAAQFATAGLMERVEKELAFEERYKIRTWFIGDADYPVRLKRCPDAPVLLYGKGVFDFETPRVVAVVGTRRSTERGRKFCQELIHSMSERGNYMVISGLAYGIDVAAHRACLQYDVPTLAVLGHGLDRIYPSEHRAVAERLMTGGGLLTEFCGGTDIDRSNFVRRNRIIAGLADATVVVESAQKGGALITADIAASYDRDVFAVPGNPADHFSKGCNALIKKNMAALIESLDDLEYGMSWQKSDAAKVVEPSLFTDLTDEEQACLDAIGEEMMSIDDLCHILEMTSGKISATLLDLECKGVIKSLPGKMYRRK
ncbi:MAG: DNA-processing protein DprA [Bacteroidales bacterium]|jgi:DNA processing protein|nr:DNA-processing protein DprA [Bacteroidales bacterium]